MEYIFKRFSVDLINDFKYIFEATRNEKVCDEWFYKKYNTNVFGEDFIGYIAYSDNGEASAFYGVFPILVRFDNHTILAAQSGDTMTHPNHRKKGLFRMLFFKTAELCKELGVKFIIGFPNHNSYPGLIKFGWTSDSNAIRLDIEVKLKKIIPRAIRKISPRLSNFLRNKYINKRKTNLSEIISKINYHSKSKIYIERNLAYLSYKTFFDNFFIQLPSCILWGKVDGGTLFIGDLFNVQKSDKEKIIEDLINFSRKVLCHVVRFVSNAEHNTGKLLITETNFSLSNHLCIYRIDPECKFENNDFEYTLADIDVF
jgi:hypothetical protein